MARIVPGRHQPEDGQPWARDLTFVGEVTDRDWSGFYDNTPIADGVLLEDIVLTGGTTTTVEHTLGREYRGFIRVRSTVAGSAIGDVTRVDTHISLSLDVAVTQTVSLWVF